MHAFLMVVHVGACVLMILVVLLQAGRGAGLAVFGGGGGDQLFTTPTTTGFMKQLTSGLAITFAITSLLLTLLHGRAGMSSVTSRVQMPSAPPPQQAPAAPPAAAPAAQPPAAAAGSGQAPAPSEKYPLGTGGKEVHPLPPAPQGK